MHISLKQMAYSTKELNERFCVIVKQNHKTPSNSSTLISSRKQSFMTTGFFDHHLKKTPITSGDLFHTQRKARKARCPLQTEVALQFRNDAADEPSGDLDWEGVEPGSMDGLKPLIDHWLIIKNHYFHMAITYHNLGPGEFCILHLKKPSQEGCLRAKAKSSVGQIKSAPCSIQKR